MLLVEKEKKRTARVSSPRLQGTLYRFRFHRFGINALPPCSINAATSASVLACRDGRRFRRLGRRDLLPDTPAAAALALAYVPEAAPLGAHSTQLSTRLGAASGFKSAIIYQMQAKLAIGLDTHGPEALKLRHLMPTVAEAPEGAVDEEEYDKMDIDAPGTVEKPRTGRRAKVN